MAGKRRALFALPAWINPRSHSRRPMRLPCQGTCRSFIAPNKDGFCWECRRASLQITPPSAPAYEPPTTRTIDGVDYDVIWNGTASLFPPDDHSAGLGRTLSGYSFAVRR